MSLTTAKRIGLTYRFEPAEMKVISSKEIPSEHEEQRAFISWWRKSGLPLIHAIPNGGGRSRVEAARLKAEGVVKGVPDLFCPALCLWIEMKRQRGGVVSKEQKEIAKHLSECGYTVIFPKGAADAAEQVQNLFAK